MKQRARSLIVFALKLLVAATLIGWLIRGGALDFGKIGVFVERPSLLAMDLFVVVTGVFVATLRWRVLLGLADVRAPFLRLLQLQATALFFNVVIPGNVGGDVVKSLYVARDEPPEKRTTILLIVFVERLLGLAGLVTMGALVTLARPSLFDDPLLRPLAISVVVLGAGTLIGPALFVLLMRRTGDRLESWTSGPSRLAKLLNQLVAAFRLLAAGPRRLVTALALSMASHALAMALFTMLLVAITGQDVPYTSVATIFPLGLLTIVLPISPAGLGVGHVAFEKLFEAIGLVGGSNVYNVYILGQLAPCLLGVFPYLALRRSQPPVETSEAASVTSADSEPQAH